MPSRSDKLQNAATEHRSLYVASLEKGFRVLQAFRTAQRQLGLKELSLTDIAKFAELDMSAAQRFTNTLLELGYLTKDANTRRYRPAAALADFYYTFMMSNQLTEIAMPRLISASKIYNTTVNFGELVGTDLLYTIRLPHEKTSYRLTLPGRRMPAFCTAGGITILAHRPKHEVEAVLQASTLDPITPHTITSLRSIRKRILDARRNGYDIGVEQAHMHEISTAAAVLNSDGMAIAAVQIPVYMPNWTVEEAKKKIMPLVIETARSISGLI